MSTKITTIYDRLVTTLGLAFPSHLKLSNPYNVQQNDFKLLNKGYGFYMSSGLNTNRMLACEMSIQRDVTIVQTIVHRGTDRDLAIRQAAEKSLLEDHFLLVKTLELDADLNSNCARFIYVSDTGISFLSDEQRNFLTISSIYTFEYFERLT